jgi:hypothetical protein
VTAPINPWCLLGGSPPDGLSLAEARAWCERLADLASPALAAHLTAEAAAAAGVSLVAPERARKALLFNRFTLANQLSALTLIAEAGIGFVGFKGLANAHTLYPSPDIRIVGDADILIRRRDLDRLLAVLGAKGFRFERVRPSPWGFMARTSYLPMVSPNGACALDIHTEVDSFPSEGALPAETVFEAARTWPVGNLALAVPAPEHTLMILATNAANDKFGPASLRKVLDARVLLARPEGLDWPMIETLARKARLTRPLGTFLALLEALGANGRSHEVPDRWRPKARRTFARMVSDYRNLIPSDPSLATKLAREVFLGADPWAAAALGVRRLKGLIRPASGAPPGWPVN